MPARGRRGLGLRLLAPLCLARGLGAAARGAVRPAGQPEAEHRQPLERYRAVLDPLTGSVHLRAAAPGPLAAPAAPPGTGPGTEGPLAVAAGPRVAWGKLLAAPWWAKSLVCTAALADVALLPRLCATLGGRAALAAPGPQPFGVGLGARPYSLLQPEELAQNLASPGYTPALTTTAATAGIIGLLVAAVAARAPSRRQLLRRKRAPFGCRTTVAGLLSPLAVEGKEEAPPPRPCRTVFDDTRARLGASLLGAGRLGGAVAWPAAVFDISDPAEVYVISDENDPVQEEEDEDFRFYYSTCECEKDLRSFDIAKLRDLCGAGHGRCIFQGRATGKVEHWEDSEDWQGSTNLHRIMPDVEQPPIEEVVETTPLLELR